KKTPLERAARLCRNSLVSDRLRRHEHRAPKHTFGKTPQVVTRAIQNRRNRRSAGLVPWPSATALVSQQYGLLSGDAMIVAVMQHYGLTNLATHDDDFDRVPWLNRDAPV
ncbi:MAG TPA: PIN domain-containing protein, partial [Pirellulales bacterium]|nr:PIN domain-containing protein [Pirellulales bacterium]